MTKKSLALGLIFVWFFAGGIAHFTSTQFFLDIMPPYVPYHLAMVYISGVFEIIGAVGILVPKLRVWAGRGLFLLVICVTPANIHMWMNPELFPDVPEIFLSIRLLIQVLLLACIWWATQYPNDKTSLDNS